MTFLVLDTVDKNLLLNLGEVIATTQPVFTSHYYDSLEENIQEKSSDGVFNSTSYVVAVDYPASTVRRIAKEISVYNSDTIQHTFILTLNNGGDKRIISSFTVEAGASATVSTEIYRGLQGNQGNQGYQGNQGVQGAQGYQGVGIDKIVFNEQTGTTYTLVTSDAGKMVIANNANPITLYIDTNTNQPMDVGTVITIEQRNTGVVTVTPQSGVTINSTSRKSWGRYTVIQVYKVDTNTWNVVGGVA